MIYYVACGTSLVGGVFAEVSDPGYARQAVNFTSLVGGSMSNVVGMTFGAFTAPQTITARALFDSAIGGNSLLAWSLPAAEVVSGGGTVAVGAASMGLTFRDLAATAAAGSESNWTMGTTIGQTRHGSPILACCHLMFGANGFAAVPNAPAHGPTFQVFGDSRAYQFGKYQTGNAAYPTMLLQHQGFSVFGWANKILGGRLSMDLSLGYQGPGSSLKVMVLNGGKGYKAPTVTAASGNAVFGPPVLGANGAIVSVPVVSSSGYTSTPALTIADVAGAGANLLAVVQGSGTFGNPGETSTQALARLQADPALTAALAVVDNWIIMIGTNDLTAGLPYATTTANLASIFQFFLSAGKRVWFIPDHPRSAWSLSGQSLTNARRQLHYVTKWVRRYAQQDRAVNDSRQPRLVLIDAIPECTDQSSANGDPLPGWLQDGLHHGVILTYALGQKLARQAGALFGLNGVAPDISASQSDIYDPIYNRTGALNSNPLLTGTAGTVTAPVTGQAPTGLTVSRGAGSASTVSAVGSFESAGSRADGYSGTRYVVTIATSAGSNFEQFNVTGGFETLASLGITGGDVIYAEWWMTLSGQALVNELFVQLDIYDGSGNNLAQVLDGQATTSGGYFPGAAERMGSIPTLGDNVPLLFRTPPVTVPANATQLRNRAFISLDATGSAAATWKIAYRALKKVS